MRYNNLNDFTRRKAALQAELSMHEKQLAKLKKQLLTTEKPAKKKRGLFGKIAPALSLSTVFATVDGALFAWKLYRKLKK